MKNKKTFHYFSILCCSAVLLLCSYGENAYGYIVNKTAGGATIKWSTPSAGYYVNLSSGPAGSLSAIQAAMNTWTNVATSSFSFGYNGQTASNAYGVNDGTNLICFGAISEGTTIALNTTWYNSSTGILLDSDIRFNTSFSWATDGSAANIDVQTIILHELGHALALADLYGDSDTAKVMYGYCGAGVIKRTLAQDDIDGITYIYGNGSTTTTTGGGSCPADYPVDCYNGGCCPANTVCHNEDKTCVGSTTTTAIIDGTCPEGYPIDCYNGYCCPSNTVCSYMPGLCINDAGICPLLSLLGEGNPEIENLRNFRDSTLAQSAVGRKIIQIYYNNADSITAALDKSPALRAVTRRVLETIAPMLGAKKD
jgi:hypothetical protein